jgi:hypothetical protein
MTDNERATLALDLTHAIGERGPKTFLARKRIAIWLDAGGPIPPRVKGDSAWLLTLAKKEHL